MFLRIDDTGDGKLPPKVYANDAMTIPMEGVTFDSDPFNKSSQQGVFK